MVIRWLRDYTSAGTAVLAIAVGTVADLLMNLSDLLRGNPTSQPDHPGGAH